MTQIARSVAGLVMYSGDPDRLSRFYMQALGLPLARARHGSTPEHHEGLLGGTHIAIWDRRQGHGAAPLIPVYRVPDVARISGQLLESGALRLHQTIHLGDGKQVAGFTDPDGRAFRVIQID